MIKEALKLALEALSSGEKMKANGIGWWEYDSRLVKQAITAIKEALAQPAPPPPECKTEAEQTAYAFGWWKALEAEPRNFCPRCGKRTADLTAIHTCTPPEGGHQ